MSDDQSPADASGDSPQLLALAAEPIDAIDLELLAAMREVYSRIDPVPGGLTDRIKFELTLAALHAEVAELQHVSLAGVRDEAAHYTPTESVTFTSSRLSLMVTLGPGREEAPDTVRVDGWVTGGTVTVELRIGDESRLATPDEDGRFVITDVPHGAARFVLRPVDDVERPVITPVVEI
ncbi:MAG TPA: hypothetical protein P5181_00330 [Dermatophilaceae bacterium]|nr:hypothetical protein [Dermatophilaceae bacterium]